MVSSAVAMGYSFGAVDRVRFFRRVRAFGLGSVGTDAGAGLGGGLGAAGRFGLGGATGGGGRGSGPRHKNAGSRYGSAV